jgi:hypothetical protein
VFLDSVDLPSRAPVIWLCPTCCFYRTGDFHLSNFLKFPQGQEQLATSLSLTLNQISISRKLLNNTADSNIVLCPLNYLTTVLKCRSYVTLYVAGR